MAELARLEATLEALAATTPLQNPPHGDSAHPEEARNDRPTAPPDTRGDYGSGRWGTDARTGRTLEGDDPF